MTTAPATITAVAEERRRYRDAATRSILSGDIAGARALSADVDRCDVTLEVLS